MDMKVITTDCKRNKYWEEQDIKMQEIPCMEAVTIYPEVKRQEMKGFGGAFTESSAFCYSSLSDQEKENFINAYFGEDGLRYNIGRTHLNSCDFALSNYAADEGKIHISDDSGCGKKEKGENSSSPFSMEPTGLYENQWGNESWRISERRIL